MKWNRDLQFLGCLGSQLNKYAERWFWAILNTKKNHRNCCFGVVTLCSPKMFLFISMILTHLNCFYSIFAKTCNSYSHFRNIKNIEFYLGFVVLVSSLYVQPKKKVFTVQFAVAMLLDLDFHACVCDFFFRNSHFGFYWIKVGICTLA